MPLVQTRGAASAQGFGEFAQVTAVNYIEDVFSTYLYTGNGSTQTITNGIDLSTKGGLVWIKSRSGTFAHRLTDTVRGATKELVSNAVTIEATVANSLTAFNSTGFALGSDIYYNNNTSTYASWTFREQPKFFDIVTYTGNAVTGRAIPHNLGSVPGCIIIKSINDTTNWVVWHRSGSQNNTDGAYLNTSAPYSNKAIELWGSDPGTPNMNATTFSVGENLITNGNGYQYVAYLFAHDAGGFGLTGTDNVISCGSFTTDGSGNGSVTLGYEPQFLITKGTDGGTNWNMVDTMRGATADGVDSLLRPNLISAEISASNCFKINSTGFSGGSNILSPSTEIIYIAIRRGPMKVPTVGTSVFAPVATTGTGTDSRIITGVGFSPDLIINCTRNTSLDRYTQDRLRGLTQTIYTNTTAAEQSTVGIYAVGTLDMLGFTQGTSASGGFNSTSNLFVFQCFKRAPSFFDEVCYSGTGSIGNIISHNLGAAPELMIIKGRAGTVGANDWQVLSKITASNYVKLVLNSTSAELGPFTYANNAGLAAQPTSTTFTVNNTANFNNGSTTYVAYLFATCAGVSKVGSYTGTGATQTIDCGFGASGSRFVLIKRTDSTGDWYVWDSARGMISGTDPSLLLNSTGAEVNANSVYAISTGFQIVSTAAGINASAGTYIFLSVA